MARDRPAASQLRENTRSPERHGACSTAGMKLTARLALVPFAVLALALFACAGAEDDSSAPPLADASIDNLYSGGGSVIPSGSDDGGSAGQGGTYGYGYGAQDGGTGSPCPRDASAEHAGRDSGAMEAGTDGASDADLCTTDLGPGDLVIDELMIASHSGSGDHGEWLEVRSTRSCVTDLKGLYAEVPHGMGTTTASIDGDVLVPPLGFFLIADSALPSVNDNLPGAVIVWGSGTSSDVLLNSGDTITLYTATATIDTLTYPSSAKLVDGSSMAFPANCPPASRSEFGNWQPSLTSWTPGLFGTPMAPNTDVSCPLAPPPAPTSSPCDG
jgi:hypothetical protein